MNLRSSCGGISSLVTALLVFACLGAPAAAQDSTPAAGGEPTLASLSVALWPEYDRPEMLVIYWGEFTPDVSLPVAVEWRIPASAGGPSALAADDPEKGLLNLEYTSRVDGDWMVLSFELATSGFQLEYYAPLTTSGDEKTYGFTYPGDYPVTAFSLSAQVPRTAQGFTLDPPADSVTEGSEGLTYHELQTVAIAAGGTKSWTVRYVKADTLLSGPSQPAEGAAVTSQPEADGGTGNSTVWIFLIAFIALVAVGAGAFWLGRRSSGPSGPDGGEAQVAYCHLCGARVPRDARFCPKCSAPVRDR